MHLTHLSVERYKCFAQREDLEIRPLTLLIGRNSSGKSVLARLPLLLRHALSGRGVAPLDFEVEGVTFGIVAPDTRDSMLLHAREFAEQGVPFIFDPGQAMPLFDGAEFRAFIEQAQYVTVNDYESSLLQRNTGWSEKDIAQRVKAYIVTRGPKGSLIHTAQGTLEIPPAAERRITDPTGCGDAYRAGLIYSLQRGMDLATAGRVASLMGALKIEHPGTQNQRFTYAEFAEQFRQQFGYSL